MLSSTYPVQLLCQMVGLPRSSYYYCEVEGEQAQLKSAIESVAAEFPTYGSRRVTAQLKRVAPELQPLGRRRVRRLMEEMGLKVRRKKGRKQTTNSEHSYPRYPNLVKDLRVSKPNEVWVCDITYIKLGNGEFVYLAIVMDVFTRVIRGWGLSKGLGVELTLSALKRAMEEGRPQIHHSDQGLQYAASDYVDELKAAGVKISMAEVGQAQQNGYAERVIRTIKEEEVYLSEYKDYEEALIGIGHFIEEVYLRKRIHSSLGYMTPAEYEAQWQKQQLASIL